jgi:HMG box factor
MSYDRVLTKPVALHCDSTQVSLSRPTSNLLEHKLGNDDIVIAKHLPEPVPASSYRYSESLPEFNLLSCNWARVGGIQARSSPPTPLETLTSMIIPYRDQSSVSERSSSSSPVKSAAPTSSVDSVTQFCLCQPEPKIPRPRNGMFFFQEQEP